MRKIHRLIPAAAMALGLAASKVSAQLVYEPFDYGTASTSTNLANLSGATGVPPFSGYINPMSGQYWADTGTNTSPASNVEYTIQSGNLGAVSGLDAPSGKSAGSLNVPGSRTPRIGLGPTGFTAPGTTIYYSLSFQLNDLTGLAASTSTAGAIIAALNNAAGTDPKQPTIFGSELRVRKDPDGTDFNIGFSGNAPLATTDVKWDTTKYSPSQSVFVVASYLIKDDNTKDVQSLWINPLPANFGSPSVPGATFSITGSFGITGTNAIRSLALRSGNASEPLKIQYDEIRADTTWAQVTAPSGTSLTASGGSWSDPTQWSDGVPTDPAIDSPHSFAYFNGGGGTINVSGNQTVGTLTFVSNNSYTIGGSGSLTLSDNTINLQAKMDTTGPDVALAGSHNVGANVVLVGANANLTVNAAMNQTVTVSGNISTPDGGDAGITKNGPGTLVLGGNNSFAGAGTTNVNLGTLKVTSSTALPTGPLNLSNSSFLDVGSGSNITVGALTQTVSSGPGNTGVAPGVFGGISGAGTITATSYALQGGVVTANLTGTSATLTKSGAGAMLTLSGTNTYTGTTTLAANGNTLLATSPASLPGYGTLHQVSALDNTANIFTTLGVSAGGSGQWTSGNIDTLLANAYWGVGSMLGINVDTGNTFSYGSTLAATKSDASNLPGLAKLGAGSLAITGTANTYTGNTQVVGGLLHFSTTGGYGATSGILVSSGAAVGLDTGSRTAAFITKIANNGVASTGALALANSTGDNGGNIDFTTGGASSDGLMGNTNTLGMSIGAMGTVSYTGIITPPTSGTNSGTYALGGALGTLVMANTNAITGAGKNLKATNGGTVILSSTNDFTGTTTINGGTTLQINPGSIGSTSSITIDGGTLQWAPVSPFELPNVPIVIGANGGTIDTNGSGNNIGYGSSPNGMSGGVLTKIGSGTFYTAAGNMSGAISGLIAKAGTFQFYSEGQITSGSTNTAFTLDGGTISTVSSWNALGSHPINVTSNGGSVGILNSSTVTWIGPVTGNGSFSKIGNGTMVLTSADTNAGSTNVTGGKLSMQANILGASAVSASGAGSVLEMATGGGNNRLIKTSAVSASGGGQINLQDNKMIVTTPGSLAAVSGLIQAGRDGGTWDGTGIVTGQASAAGNTMLTTLAVDTAGDAGKTMFDNVTVSPTDTLVMYTYAGDANLDGKINGDDYFRIDSAYGTSASGYANGDFNYDGRIDADDYFVIDKNYSEQSLTPFASSAPVLDGVSAVPEPASVAGLLVAGSMLGLRRRKRKSIARH